MQRKQRENTRLEKNQYETKDKSSINTKTTQEDKTKQRPDKARKDKT